jgi:hypothetical protein
MIWAISIGVLLVLASAAFGFHRFVQWLKAELATIRGDVQQHVKRAEETAMRDAAAINNLLRDTHTIVREDVQRVEQFIKDHAETIREDAQRLRGTAQEMHDSAQARAVSGRLPRRERQ